MRHAARQLPSWLIFDVGQNQMGSSILRIICGVALIAVDALAYIKNSAAIAAGGQVRVFGVTLGTAGWPMTAAFFVIGLIGFLFVVLGVAGLFKNRQ